MFGSCLHVIMACQIGFTQVRNIKYDVCKYIYNGDNLLEIEKVKNLGNTI